MFRKVGAPDFRKKREREKEGEDLIQQTNKFGSIKSMSHLPNYYYYYMCYYYYYYYYYYRHHPDLHLCLLCVAT